MIRAYFLLLAGYLSRKYAEQTTRASRELVRLSNVVGFIEAHFRESLTLSDLVDVACMSESTLLRAFKRCYGTTPVDYVIRYRLKEACDLMGETTCSLSDVAQMVGFSDSNYFSRRFHREYGMSPRDYRRRLTSQT
jgi:AraC-like DNA-binding protein